MPWTPGSIHTGGIYMHRTPVEKDKVPYTMTGASLDQATNLLDYFEMMGRQPMTIEEVRALLGPTALMGEKE
jgi:hypothetical protein